MSHLRLFAFYASPLLMGMLLSVAACGDNKPPPKTEETVKEDDSSKTHSGGGGPSVSQELGSIDERAVAQTFEKLQGKIEGCIKQGRDRVEYMSGDMKVFLRITGEGKVKYSFFEESSLGDRDSEKCILDSFGATSWPKPQGGEAEVRNGFGYPAGSERAPTSWDADKVTGALDDDAKKAIKKCKAGVSGDFKLTGYVEQAEGDDSSAAPAPAKPTSKASSKATNNSKKQSKKGDKKSSASSAAKAEAAATEHGKFKAIGIAAPGKEAAAQVDCVLDAIRNVSLPSPGSYAAKVTFTL